MREKYFMRLRSEIISSGETLASSETIPGRFICGCGFFLAVAKFQESIEASSNLITINKIDDLGPDSNNEALWSFNFEAFKAAPYTPIRMSRRKSNYESDDKKVRSYESKIVILIWIIPLECDFCSARPTHSITKSRPEAVLIQFTTFFR